MKRKHAPFSAINIIPFVDVMLVLLAIILTTSTLVEKKLIPVSLPKADATQKIEKKSSVITITHEGKLRLDDAPIELLALETSLDALDLATPILINCDENGRFKTFVDVLSLLNKKNFQNLSIVTQP